MNNAFKKRIDELGRIVIPKQIREDFKINNYDELDIYIKDENIVIKKNIGLLQFKEKFDRFLKFINDKSVYYIIITDKNNFISSNYNESLFDYTELKDVEYNNVIILKNKYILKMNIIIDSNYLGDLYFICDNNFNKEHVEIKSIKDIILDFIK